MSKVIDYNSTWYQEVAPRDFYKEDDLERDIMHNLQIIFPEFIPFPFKQKLFNNITKQKNAPDLAMVKNDYSEWYVIEVELGKHSKSEVIKQIDTFKNHTYNIENVNYIYRQYKKFDKNKLTKLITDASKPPLLMVIVNETKMDWKDDLEKLNCKICVFQIYNDFGGNKLYRLSGDHPYIFTDFCNCKYEKRVPYAVKILKNDFLDGYSINNGTRINIEYNGKVYSWERKDVGQEVFLICNSSIPPLDSLSYRYRLNYNKGFTEKKYNLSWLYSKIFNKDSKNIITKFSFTKD